MAGSAASRTPSSLCCGVCKRRPTRLPEIPCGSCRKKQTRHCKGNRIGGSRMATNSCRSMKKGNRARSSVGSIASHRHHGRVATSSTSIHSCLLTILTTAAALLASSSSGYAAEAASVADHVISKNVLARATMISKSVVVEGNSGSLNLRGSSGRFDQVKTEEEGSDNEVEPRDESSQGKADDNDGYSSARKGSNHMFWFQSITATVVILMVAAQFKQWMDLCEVSTHPGGELTQISTDHHKKSSHRAINKIYQTHESPPENYNSMIPCTTIEVEDETPQKKKQKKLYHSPLRSSEAVPMPTRHIALASRSDQRKSYLARRYDCATWNMYSRIISAREARTKCGICMGSLGEDEEDSSRTVTVLAKKNKMMAKENTNSNVNQDELTRLIQTCPSPLYFDNQAGLPEAKDQKKAASATDTTRVVAVHKECFYGAMLGGQDIAYPFHGNNNMVFHLEL